MKLIQDLPDMRRTLSCPWSILLFQVFTLCWNGTFYRLSDPHDTDKQAQYFPFETNKRRKQFQQSSTQEESDLFEDRLRHWNNTYTHHKTMTDHTSSYRLGLLMDRFMVPRKLCLQISIHNRNWGWVRSWIVSHCFELLSICKLLGMLVRKLVR